MVLAGSTRVLPPPWADRTACGAYERAWPGRSTSRPDGRRTGSHGLPDPIGQNWQCERSLRYAMPAALVRSLRRRAGAAVSTRFRPLFFARYNALSAACKTTSGSAFASEEPATPILTVTESAAGNFGWASWRIAWPFRGRFRLLSPRRSGPRRVCRRSPPRMQNSDAAIVTRSCSR
jgi:hypothetical protein